MPSRGPVCESGLCTSLIVPPLGYPAHSTHQQSDGACSHRLSVPCTPGSSFAAVRRTSSALDQIPHWRSCVSLLGGALRTEVQAYATGLYRRKSGDPLRYLAEEAAGYVAEGFKAVKLKVGFGVEEDVAATRAVRSAIGADVALMVDANHAYDAVDAIRLGRKIEGHDIGWFEEPVPPEDLVGYRAVKAALSIPIAGGE